MRFLFSFFVDITAIFHSRLLFFLVFSRRFSDFRFNSSGGSGISATIGACEGAIN